MGPRRERRQSLNDYAGFVKTAQNPLLRPICPEPGEAVLDLRLGFVAFSVAAPFVGALFGLFPLDLVNFSGYGEAIESLPGGEEVPSLAPIRTIALVVLLTLPLQALLLVPFTFAEEWGWRGYLLP